MAFLNTQGLQTLIAQIKAWVNNNFAKNTEVLKSSMYTIDPARLRGDANGDGVVDERDAQLIKEYLLGKVSESDLDMTLADINIDGKVSISDFMGIRAFLLDKANTNVVDLNNKWNLDAETMRWYYDLAVSGMAETNVSVIISIVSGQLSANATASMLDANKIRIYSTRTPTTAINAIVTLIPNGDYTVSICTSGEYPLATEYAAGLMSAEDKAKLNKFDVTYGTEDLIAGESTLDEGVLYLVYAGDDTAATSTGEES